ncbi:hypothetical protein ACET3Z_014666 [Daucus carota]
MLLIIFSNYVSHLLQLKCTQVPAQGGAAKKNCSPIINREHKKSSKLVEDKGSFISYWGHKRSNNQIAVRRTPKSCVNPNSSEFSEEIRQQADTSREYPCRFAFKVQERQGVKDLYEGQAYIAPSEQRCLRDKEEKSNQTTVTGMSDDLFILVVERTISCAREHPNMYGLTPNDRVSGAMFSITKISHIRRIRSKASWLDDNELRWMRAASRSNFNIMWNDPTQKPITKYFILHDLWLSFEKWSAYGAKTKVIANREVVDQFFVQSLSAIQIFTNKPYESVRYPVCHIPNIGIPFKDFEAAFLTFHSISSFYQDIPEEDVQMGCNYKHSSISLPPFGCVTYKVESWGFRLWEIVSS